MAEVIATLLQAAAPVFAHVLAEKGIKNHL
jgi:hypothetical protein